MTQTMMRQQISQRIQTMPGDQLTMIWELVSKGSAHTHFDVDAFLTWRERQRAQELILEAQRLNQVEVERYTGVLPPVTVHRRVRMG